MVWIHCVWLCIRELKVFAAWSISLWYFLTDFAFMVCEKNQHGLVLTTVPYLTAVYVFFITARLLFTVINVIEQCRLSITYRLKMKYNFCLENKIFFEGNMSLLLCFPGWGPCKHPAGAPWVQTWDGKYKVSGNNRGKEIYLTTEEQWSTIPWTSQQTL